MAQPILFKLTGNIINATTGQKISPLKGAVVTVTENATKKVINAVVDVAGSTYSANVPAGEYTVTGGATDFISATLVTRVSVDIREDLILAPSVTDLTTRIVLKWNLASPRPVDLDMYVANLNNKDEKVYYLAKRSPSGKLVLDVDNVQNGPETVTISKDSVDIFQIAVKNYNNAVPLIRSGAEVDIYRGNNLVKSIQVPMGPEHEAKAGWDIGIYNAKDGTFTLNNRLI
jgi:stress response protein SCP2